MIRTTMPRQGVLLETFFTGDPAIQVTRSIASTMNQRRRRDIIEPTLKASDRGPQHARFLRVGVGMRSRKGWVS